MPVCFLAGMAFGQDLTGPTFGVFAGPGSQLHDADALPGGYLFVPAGLLLTTENERGRVGGPARVP